MSSGAERLTYLCPADFNHARREAQSRRMICENDVAEDRIQVEVDLFTRLVVFPTTVSPLTTSFRTSTTFRSSQRGQAKESSAGPGLDQGK